MIIGITQRVNINNFEERQDALDQRWYDFAKLLGITLIPIPNNIEDPIVYLNDFRVSGFIFSGGNDVSFHYHERAEPIIMDIVPERDLIEQKILQHAIESNLPVLGVCRGAQFINVYLGGGLVPVDIDKHVSTQHKIDCLSNSHIKFRTSQLDVNSFHKYGIVPDVLASSLEAIALFDENEIEAFHHKAYKILGILWHPERYGSSKFHDLDLVKQLFSL